MKKLDKQYPLHQSPFYKLSSKKKLSTLLQISNKQLLLLVDDSKYHTFMENGREIQEPIGLRKIVHKRIKELLSRIECPNYLYSGVKGKSAIKNAVYHKENFNFATFDIKSFYRSSRIEYVFRFFYYVMKMDVDVARIISHILCYMNFIPTGSSSSQLLAFWSYSILFEKINYFSQKHNIRFSLYVDDMTFSSKNRIPKNFENQVNKLLNNVELCIKKKKTRYYFENENKNITGCVITNDNTLKVADKHKKNIIRQLNLYNNEESYLLKLKIRASLLGSIAHAQQIETGIFNTTKTRLRNE